MKRTVLILLAAVFGLIAGVSATSWRAFPTEDMIARATCAGCHDVHGAIEWADAPFQSQVWILGDVPEATYFFVDDLFPYRDAELGTAVKEVEDRLGGVEREYVSREEHYKTLGGWREELAELRRLLMGRAA